MSYSANIVIIIAGFYLAFRVSLRGAFFTGLAIGVALALLESLSPSNPDVGLLTIFASRILGAVPVYMLANHCEGILAFLLIVPLGFLLILAGGPIECALMFTE